MAQADVFNTTFNRLRASVNAIWGEGGGLQAMARARALGLLRRCTSFTPELAAVWEEFDQVERARGLARQDGCLVQVDALGPRLVPFARPAAARRLHKLGQHYLEQFDALAASGGDAAQWDRLGQRIEAGLFSETCGVADDAKFAGAPAASEMLSEASWLMTPAVELGSEDELPCSAEITAARADLVKALALIGSAAASWEADHAKRGARA